MTAADRQALASVYELAQLLSSMTENKEEYGRSQSQNRICKKEDGREKRQCTRIKRRKPDDIFIT